MQGKDPAAINIIIDNVVGVTKYKRVSVEKAIAVLNADSVQLQNGSDLGLDIKTAIALQLCTLPVQRVVTPGRPRDRETLERIRRAFVDTVDGVPRRHVMTFTEFVTNNREWRAGSSAYSDIQRPDPAR
jgi:hypothetical protein